MTTSRFGWIPFAGFVSTLFLSCGPNRPVSLRPEGLYRDSSVTLHTGDIHAAFIDNSAMPPVHRSGYNGIAALSHKQQDSSLFVPLFAGFNLEHIFGGDSLDPLFEPRVNPMELYKKSDRVVLLYQPATPLSHVESLTSFTLREPQYIDVTFKCVLHDLSFFSHGYAGLFWASYIDHPEDRSITFLGSEEGDETMVWVSPFTDTHGVASTHRGIDDRLGLFFADNFNATLASHYSNYRYSKPFYYGRYKNMVLAYLFDPYDDGVIRFSQSPNGGGDVNPAWDFQFIIPDPETEKIYEFRARIVYKPFEDSEDIEEEYRSWKED